MIQDNTREMERVLTTLAGLYCYEVTTLAFSALLAVARDAHYATISCRRPSKLDR